MELKCQDIDSNMSSQKNKYLFCKKYINFMKDMFGNCQHIFHKFFKIFRGNNHQGKLNNTCLLI